MSKKKLSRKNKIAICFIMAVIVIAALCYNINTVIADGISILNKGKNYTYGGEYKEVFDSSRLTDNEIYSIKWADLENKYYYADGAYESYTANMKRIVCMNEGKSDWYSSYVNDGKQRYLRPAAIIDIEGGYATVQGTISKNSEKTYVGKYAAQLAWAAYDEGSIVTNKPETYVNEGAGWINFYTKAPNIDIDKEKTLKNNTGINEASKKLYEITDISKYADISTSGSGVANTSGEEDVSITKEVGTFTVNGAKYKTKIGPYNLQNVNGTTKVVTAKVGSKLYKGTIIKKAGTQQTYYLYFTDKITSTIDSIKFTQSYKSYKARIIVLATNFSQSRAIMIGKKDYTVRNEVDLKIPNKEIDVSLQKFIFKVNGKSLTSNETELRSRRNTYSAENEWNGEAKKPTSKKEENKMINEYKLDNTVNIEKGDTVTYRVHVYNNSNTQANNIKIADRLPQKEVNGQKVSLAEIVDIKYHSGVDMTSKWTLNNEIDTKSNSAATYTYTIPVLNSNTSAYFDITLKYNEFTEDILTNTAWIYSTNPANNTIYRTVDRDYIKMKTPAVSLEKYVKRVDDPKDATTDTTIDVSMYEYIKSYLAGSKDTNKLADLKTRSDINKDGNIDEQDIQLLQQYIDLGINNIEGISNAQKELEIINAYGSSDINEDGVVDNTDLEIFKILSKGTTRGAIEQYIRLDIDKDGIFDSTDKNIYKQYFKDINGDKVLNDTDNYLTFIYLKKLSKNNESELDLEKIKTNYIYENENIDDVYNTIRCFAISDVNQDGVVDEYDEDFWDRNIGEITNFDTTASNNDKITSIKDIIKRYDFNFDDKVNENDIDAFKIIKGAGNWTDAEIENIRKYIYDSNLDLDKNKSIEIMDYTIDENGNTIITGDVLILELRNRLIDFDMDDNFSGKPASVFGGIISKCKNNNAKYYLYDINTDNKITKEDHDEYNRCFEAAEKLIANLEGKEKELCNSIDFIKFFDEYVKTYGNIDFAKLTSDLNISEDYYSDFKNIDEFIGKKDFPSELDFNGDGKVTDKDKTELVKRDLNNDSCLDYYDYEIYNTYLRVINCGEPYNTSDNTELIYAYYIEDAQFTDSDKEYLLNSEKNINPTNLDIKGSGLVDEEDLNLWDQYIDNEESYRDRCKNTDRTKIETILKFDINGDGVFDESDYNLIKKYSSIDNLDLNKDGQLNSNDINLLSEVINSKDTKNEDIINAINSSTSTTYEKDRAGKAEYLTEQNGKYVDNTKNDSQWTQHNTYKYDNVVNVSNGQRVTYSIKVKNDGEIPVKNIEVKDTLPSGVRFITTQGKATIEDEGTQNNPEIKITIKDTILPGASVVFDVVVEVTEPNMSLNVLKNTAKITNMQNKNDENIEDTTPYNNEDSDYIQLNYKDGSGIISGIVWNDKALNKEQDNYNGLYDTDKENGIPNVKVYLYRDGLAKAIATKTTDDNGYYCFTDADIDEKVITNSWERYIKAPRNEDNNRWNNEHRYYSYRVVFEYDGVKYTSTPDGKTCIAVNDDTAYNNGEYKINSNAREDNGSVDENRKSFNDTFSKKMNSVKYTTKNESGYIPQSNYVYDSEIMTIQSSTGEIRLDSVKEEELQHVNLGLRGRDIFDLELTSDVYSTKVTVNGIEGEYNYNSNKVTVRKSDIDVSEDAANFANEVREATVGEVNQKIRKTDIKNEKYGDTGLKIEVTYKITVQNTSRTAGTVTKIINYFDDDYKSLKETGTNWTNGIESVSTGEPGTGYKSSIITLNNPPKLTQSSEKPIEIYLTYELDSPSETLESLLGDGKKAIPTYNMSEILEYTTECGEGQTEYTRGLIDKDSAPGSVATEKVRLHPDQIGNETTVEYYFGGNDLSVLKYEDDTYATPTLYFVSDENQRTITGTVFEDYTSINSNRVKSGNGKKDKDEPTIKGVKVQLIGNGKVIDTTTNEKGEYTFTGFLPGKYTIRYYYGDTEETFLKNYNNNGNEESYNGEDFQSTNNSYSVKDITNNILSDRKDYWYLDNEGNGISVAKDISERRNKVSENVTKFTNEEMSKLNDIRDGVQLTDIGSIEDKESLVGKTYMYSTTSSMLFTVEKSEIVNNEVVPKSEFGAYEVKNMNFGLAEVPVTTINLVKEVNAFNLMDSTGENLIAGIEKDSSTEKWKIIGNVIAPDDSKTIDVSVEDEKLQGARLQITYAIKSETNIELNYDKSGVKATISGLVDIVNNNLSYNPKLNNNEQYWEVTSLEQKNTSVENIASYNTIVEANETAIDSINNGKDVYITLEKVLSSTDSTLDEIITSTVDIYAYNNTVEITGLNYENVTPEGNNPTNNGKDKDKNNSTNLDENSNNLIPLKDRIRTLNRYIIIPGSQHDSTISQTITIHPPTGDSSINIMYYILAVISLIVLAGGVFVIKKFVIKK